MPRPGHRWPLLHPRWTQQRSKDKGRMSHPHHKVTHHSDVASSDTAGDLWRGPQDINTGYIVQRREYSYHPWAALFLIDVLSHVSCFGLFETPRVAHLVPLSMGFSKREYWSGLPFPPPRGSSPPRDQTCVSYVFCIGRWILYQQPYLGSPY